MLRTHAALGSVALLALVVSCGAGCSSRDEDSDSAEDAISAGDANAALEIHALDIWARDLDAKDLKLTVVHDGHPVRLKTSQTTTVFLKDSGSYALHLEAADHRPLDLTFSYDGGEGSIEAKDGGGYTLAHTKKSAAGRDLPTHVLNMGLRHKWFSSEGRPAREGNAVKFMMDGEEAWSTVRTELQKSKKEVLLSTWWWQSDFELVRAPIGASDETRWANTMLGTLEAIPSEKKVLVGEFIGQDTLFSLLNTDSKLRAHASQAGDHFEMMSQANETRGKFRFEIPAFSFGDRVKKEDAKALPFALDGKVASLVPPHDVDLTQVPFGADLPLASYHQKFMVVDQDVAFVGGMNVKAEDWDTSKHEVYDVQRMALGAFDVTRDLVKAKHRHPDTGPRKDYMLRIEGPAAEDVADVFHERWEELRKIKAKHSEVTTAFNVKHDIAPRANGMQVQVTATLPTPFKEHAIAETWFNAVNNAEKFIYIEDQYFRMPMINDAISKRMEEIPGLKLIVITKPVGTSVPECLQSYRSGNAFKKFGDRYLTMQLKAFDNDEKEFADMDVHSKMLIVDDIFMSVGSANKNNRGMVYEAEMNVAVVDASVGAWRKRIVSNLIGGTANDDVDGWFGQLQSVTKANDEVLRTKAASSTPRGFVYTLGFGAESSCRMQSIGPDAT